jgi:hypothetical protein
MKPNRDPLEETLARLEAPPPPDDLAQRCRDTIPDLVVPAPTRLSFRKLLQEKRTMLTQVVVCCAAVAAIVFLSTRPATRPAPGVAFAAVKRVMAQVPFYHMRFRVWNVKDNMPEASPAPDNWTMEGDQWFDAQRGFAMRTRTQGHEDEDLVRVLIQPDGKMLTRTGDVVMRMKLPIRPEDLRAASAAEPFTDPEKVMQSTGRPDANYTGHVAGVAAGTWKGKAVRVFTIERTPRQTVTAEHLPLQRALVYVDEATQRVLAWQIYTRWAEQANGSEMPAVELEYDYNAATDPSVFNAEDLKRGASQVVDVAVPSQPSAPTPEADH